MARPEGETKHGELRVHFDRCLKLEFHGSKITSDAGSPTYRELDDALGLTKVSGNIFQESRTGKNGWYGMTGQFRQSVFGRLGGYEDVNDDARHLQECENLANLIEDFGSYETHEAYEKRLKAEHGGKSMFRSLVAA